MPWINSRWLHPSSQVAKIVHQELAIEYGLGRTLAQVVSRRPLTAETRVRSRVSSCGICGGQNDTGTSFSPSTSVFPCQFQSTGAALQGKTKNNTIHHLHHRVALRMRCVRSICCGALHHKKKSGLSSGETTSYCKYKSQCVSELINYTRRSS